MDTLCQALSGVNYDYEAIAAALAPFDIERELYKITREELIKLIALS